MLASQIASRAAQRKRKPRGPGRASVHRSAFLHLKPVEFDGEEYPDYVGMADGYADAVLAGKVPENKFILLACRRYKAMREAASLPSNPFYWSPAHVVDICAFIERLPQTKGERIDEIEMPEFEDGLIILQPFQIWFLAAVFGFREDFRGRSVRWIREALFDVPRKNGKSTLAAGVNLYCFLYEQERGSDIRLAASSRGQAENVFQPIREILKAEPELQEMHGLRVTNKGVHKPDGGHILVISALGAKEDGHQPHVVQLDELHAIKPALFEVMKSSLGARANQLFLQTTTAGHYAGGPAYDQRKRAERVLHGEEKAERFFPVIYTVDERFIDNPLQWDAVVQSNPMLDVTLQSHAIRDAMENARFNPHSRAEFITKRLNVYARGAAFAISPIDWAKCADRGLRLEQFLGRKCWIGADLSQRDDQTALALIFEHSEGDNNNLLALFAEHFLPEESPAFFNEKVASQLFEWQKAGFLTVTTGPMVDLDLVQARIEAFCDVFDVEAIVFDRAHAQQIINNLHRKGLPAGHIHANSVEMSEPTKDLVIRARHGLLRHDGNPVLAWNAQNTCLTPGDLWRPIKDRTAPHLKIDGFSAACHANVARLGRVVPKTLKEEAPFDPYRIVRIFS